MTIDNKIRDEKLQYDIKEKQEKYQLYHLEKIDKYEYLTDEEIVPPYQRRMIEQAKFTYSPLGKVLKNKQKQLRTRRKTNKSN